MRRRWGVARFHQLTRVRVLVGRAWTRRGAARLVRRDQRRMANSVAYRFLEWHVYRRTNG